MKSYIVLNKENMAPKNRTYCVMGSARGGTTMVSGLLLRMGINMGNDIARATEEDREFRSITRPLEILLDPNSPDHEDMLKRVFDFIATKNLSSETWGWKDPESMTYINLIESKLVNPSYIVVYRDPLAITQKELDTGLYDNPLRVLDLVINHRYNLIQKFISSCKAPLLLISYERALRNKLELINGLCNFCNINPTESIQKSCEEFIQPGRHGRLVHG